MFLAWLFCANAWAAQPVSYQGISKLLGNRAAEVDLDGDGKPDVYRKFDSSGNWLEWKWINRAETPAVTETWTLSQDRKIWTFKRLAGDAVVRQEQESYSSPGILIERKILWSSHKAIETFSGGQIVTKNYRRTGTASRRQWKFESEKKRSAIQTQDCSNCSLPDNLDPTAIESAIRAASLVTFSGTTSNSNSLQTPLLPSEYRVETMSCKSPEAREALRQATDEVTNTILKCLEQYNPKLALEVVRAIQTRQPTLVCAGQFEYEAEIYFKCVVGKSNTNPSAYRQCVAETQEAEHNKAVKGVYYGARPNNIYLRRVDPETYSSMRKNVHELASVIFHETLHAVGLPGAANHSEFGSPGYLTGYSDDQDEVFGCQWLCRSEPSIDKKQNFAQEGCLACAQASKNKPNADVTDRCQKDFVPRASLDSVYGLWKTDSILEGCLTEHKPKACNEVGMGSQLGPVFMDLCSAKHRTIFDRECQKDMRAAIGSSIDAFLTQEAPKQGFHPSQTVGWYDFDAMVKRYPTSRSKTESSR